jgi:hypothetical protein
MRSFVPSSRHSIALVVLGVASTFSPGLADFDVTSMTTVFNLVDTILATPETQATLVQDGFRSGFLLNDSGIEVRGF